MKILSYILLILMVPYFASGYVLTGDDTTKTYMSASSVYAVGREASKGFDGINQDGWASTVSTNPVNIDGSCWVQITFPNAVQVSKIAIQGYPSYAGYNVEDFGIFGSSTGNFSGEEVELLDDTCPSITGPAWSDWFTFSATGDYKYYRMLFYSEHSGTNFGLLSEIKLEIDTTIEAQGNYIDIYNGTGSLDQPYVLELQGNYIDIYNGSATIPIITDSITLIASAPAYDEVDGYWTSEFTAQGNYIDIYNGNQTTLTKANEIQGIGNYLDIFNGTITEFTRITNSVSLIEATPSYNAVDGAWIETVYAQGNYLDIFNGDIPYLFPSWFEADGNYVDIYNHNIGSVKWQDGIEYAPGAEWYNDELTYVSGGTIDESADMITFGGF